METLRRCAARGRMTALAVGTLFAVSALAADPLATWHVRPTPLGKTAENLEGVAYGQGRWVVVGGDGSLLSSADGSVWVQENNPIAPAGLSDVVFAQGTFVAVGTRADSLITSTDGRNWTKGRTGISGIQEVIHDGTRFVAVASGGFLGVSTNGTTWVNAGKVPMRYSDAGGIAYGQGLYVVAGYMRTGKPTDLYTSPDLVTWTSRDARVNENLLNAAYAHGQWMAMGVDGALITSTDGAEWTPRDTGHTGMIWDLATHGGVSVAAAQWGRLLVTRDGVGWTRVETEFPWHFTDVAYGGGTFVAVGWDGEIVQSGPLEEGEESVPVRLQQPAWAGGRFTFSFDSVAGRTYEVEGSLDGRSWTRLASLVAGSGPTTATDLQATVPCRWYRVVSK